MARKGIKFNLPKDFKKTYKQKKTNPCLLMHGFWKENCMDCLAFVKGTSLAFILEFKLRFKIPFSTRGYNSFRSLKSDTNKLPDL